MTYTDHGLYCGDDCGEDYAAIALVMQHDAETIDAALSDISDDLSSYYERPSFIVVGTVAQTGFNANNTHSLRPTWTQLYANSLTLGPNTSTVPNFTVTKAGFYQFGGYMPMTASGAITALSDRLMTVNAFDSAFPTPLLASASYRTRETSTGGEHLSASAGFFQASVGQTILFEIAFSHANVASTMNVGIGARIWCYYVTSGVEIGSA